MKLTLKVITAISLFLNSCTGSPQDTVNCALPGNILIETTVPGETIFSWNAVTGASGYAIDYKRATSSGWTNAVTANVTSPYTLVHEIGVAYDVRFKTICSGNSSVYSYRKIWN